MFRRITLPIPRRKEQAACGNRRRNRKSKAVQKPGHTQKDGDMKRRISVGEIVYGLVFIAVCVFGLAIIFQLVAGNKIF